MNQAQRHLWARAYSLPWPIPSNTPPESVKSVKPIPNQNEHLSTGPTGSTGRKARPRILIAKPREKPLNRNDKIRQSLERAYPAEAKQILDQAYAAYYYTKPASANLPELYELLESGFLDLGIEACGLHSWVIGRVGNRQ